MQLLKQIKHTLLGIVLIATCLSFQADTLLPTTTNTNISLIVNTIELTNNDVYKIKLRKSETILGNNFSIFSFKCFLRQRKSLLATNNKQQQALQQPQQADYLIATQQTSSSEDDTLIG
jgi:hypothetical protein